MKNLYPLFRFARTIWTLILIGASVNSTTGQSAGCTCKEVSVKLDSNLCSVNLTKEILDLDAACSANLRIAVEDINPANGSVIDAQGNWTYILYTSSGDTICMGKVRAEDKSGPKLVERIDPCGRVIVSSDPAAVWRDTFPAADLGKILNIEASWQDSNYPWYTGTAVFKNRCGHSEENDCTVTSQVMDQVVKYNFCTGLQFNPIHAKISRIWTGIDCNGNKTSVIQEIYFLIPAFFSIQQQYLEQGPVSGLSLTDGGKMEWIFNGETCSPPQGSVMLDSFLANYYIFNNPQQCSAKGARGFSFFNQAVNAGRAEIAYNYPTIPYSVNARILKEASLCGVSKEVTAIISIYDWCSKTYQYDTVFIKWMDPRLEGVSITLQQPIVIPAKPGQCSAGLRIDSTNLRDILGIKFNEKCSPEIEKMFVESCLDDSGNPSLGPCAYWCAPAYPTRWDNGQAMIADIPAGAHRLVITSKNSCGEESVLNRVNFIVTADSLTACDTLLCSGYEIWPKLAKVRGRCGRTVVPDAVSLQFIDTKMLVWRDTFLSTDLPWVLNSMESWQNANYRYFAGYPTFWDSCLIVQSPECRCEVTLQVKDEVAYFPCETMTSDQVMAKIIRTFTGTDCWGHSASVVQEIFFVWPKFQPLGVREILLQGGTCSADNEAILSELKKRYYIYDDPYSCDPKEKYAWFREAVGTQSGNARKFLDSSYNFEVVLKKQEEICSRSRKLEVVVQVLDGCTGQTTILDSLWLIWGDLTAPKAIIPSGPIQLMADPEKETASFGIDPNSLEYYFGINITDNCGKDFVTEVEIWSYLESAGGVEKTWQKVNYPVKWVDFGDTLQRLMVQDIPIGSHRLHITATDLCRNQSRLDSILVQVSASNRCDPVRITSEPSSQFVQVGGTATFIVKATGTAPFSYQWRKNGVNIPGANRAAYIIPTVALSDTNSLFNCVIANCNGDSVAVSKEARLTTGCGCPDVVVFMESPTTPFQLTNEILGNTNCKTGYTISVVDNSPGDTNRIDAPGYWTYGLFDNLGKLQCWARVQAMVADCSPPGVPVPVTEQTECQALETTPTPTLNWRNVPGAKRYEVSVSKYPYGSANSIPLHNSSCISDSSYTVFPALQPGMVYRWDVRSMTSCDQFCVSDNSAGRYFYLPPVINQSQLTKGKAVLSTPEQRIAAPGFVRYQWYKDGEPVGGNSNTYIAWQQGTYTVRLTYAGGIYCGAATTISSKPFYFEGGQSTSCECREVEVILDSSTCSFNLTKEILGLDTTLCYPSASIRVEDTNPGNGSLIDAPGYWPYMLYSPLGDTICFGKVRAESISAPILVQHIGRCGQTVHLSDSFPVWRDTFLVSDIEKVLDVEASWLDSNYFWYAGAAVFRGACDKPEGLGCLVSSEVKDTIVYFSCPKDNTEAKISRMWIGRDCFGNETKAIQEIFFVWPKFQPLGEKEIVLHGGACSADNEVILSELKKRYYIYDDPYSCDPGDKYAYFQEAVGMQNGNVRTHLDGNNHFDVIVTRQEAICAGGRKLEVLVKVWDQCSQQITILDTLILSWVDTIAPTATVPSEIQELTANPGTKTASFGIDQNSLNKYFGVIISDNCGSNVNLEVEIWSLLDYEGGTGQEWRKANYPERWVGFGDTLRRLMVEGVPVGAHRLHITATDSCSNKLIVDPVFVQVLPPSMCEKVRITSEPSNQYVKEGGAAIFMVAVAGTPPFTYQWRKNGENIPGANNAAYSTPPVQISDRNNKYSCLIANCSGDSMVVSKPVGFLDLGCGCPEVSVSLASPSASLQLTHELLGNTSCENDYSIWVEDSNPQNKDTIDGQGPGYWTYGLFYKKDNTLLCQNKVNVSVDGCTVPEIPVPKMGQKECPGPEAMGSPTLSWSKAPGATHYGVTVRIFPFSSDNLIPLQDSACISDTSYTVSPALQPGMLYRWDVRSVASCNAACESANSDAYYFHVPPVINLSQFSRGKVILSTLEQLVVPPGGVSYQWFRGETPVGVNSNTYITSQQGTYTVRLTYSGYFYCDEASISSKPFLVQKFPLLGLPSPGSARPKKFASNGQGLSPGDLPFSPTTKAYAELEHAVIPNPVIDQGVLLIQNPHLEPFVLTILRSDGRIIYTQDLKAAQPEIRLDLPHDALSPAGIYFYRIQSAKQFYMGKFIRI